MSDSVRPHKRQPTRLPRPWGSPGKNTGVGCHFLLQCMKVKSESEVTQSCLTLATPWTAAYEAPPSMGFSRQECWSGVPLPSLGCSLGVSQLAEMLLPLAECLIMVLETPAWLFPSLVTASKWCVWDFCHNHFPSHFFPTSFLFWKSSCWWQFEIPH